jgi:DNA modification methylase
VTDSTVARVSQPTLADQIGSDRVPGKTNGNMKAVVKKQDGHGRRHAGFNDRYFNQDEAKPTRNRRSVWTVTTKPFKGAHFATFPPDLIEPCILAGAPAGGVVLDPFGGSGTTAGVAVKHGRQAILCELNPDFAAMIPERVAQIAGGLFARAAE